jgi:SAM-dependent methyltransferase
MTDLIERQREHFNEISAKYSEARKHPNHLLLKTLIWSNFFEDKRGLASPRIRVLEPMCGMSEGLQIIKRHLQSDIEYVGFDYSAKMVEIARNQYPTERIECRDATTYDSHGEKFDWIILVGGLHHVFLKSADVIQRLGRALNAGGYFLSFEPTQNCWLTRKVRKRIYERNGLFHEETEQGFELSHLNTMFEKMGFEKIDQVFPGLISYVLYYNPDAFPALNIGGRTAVRVTFALDRLIWRTWFAKKLSFATITLWRHK